MLLDMKTIIFSYVLTDIVCMVVIVLLWRQNQKRFAGSTFWVFNYAFQLSGLFLILLRGQISAWMSIVLANTLVIAGSILGYMGLLRFIGKKSFQIHNYVLLAAFALVHAYFTFVQPNQAARNLNTSVGLMIVCFQCAWLLLYRVESGMRQLTRDVGIVFAAYCLIGVVRIVEYFTGSHSTGDYFQSGIFEQLVLISNQMLFILLTYFLALMFNKRLLLDITTQEEKFNKAFHSSPYAVTITRMSNGQIIEVNESFFKITGYQPADIREQTTPALHLWNRDEDRALVVSELTSKGTVKEHEFQFRKKSGEIITGLFSAEIININNEFCVLSSINDITERTKMEEKLRESEKKLREVQEMAHLGSWVWNVKTGDVEWSAEIYKIYRLDPEEFIPHIDSIQALSPWPEDHQRDKELIKRAIENHEPGSYEQKFLLPDKTIGYYYSTFQGDYDEKGDLSSIIGTVMDITERKLAGSQREVAIEEFYQLNAELGKKVDERTRALHESQLALLNLVDDLNQSAKGTDLVNRKLEETNKEIAAFSYSVSHDLRAPLRSIDGFSLALLEDCRDKLDDAGKNYLGRIRQAAQHMGLLIDDMLKLSKISHAKFHHESINLSKEFQSVADTFQQSNPDCDMKVIVQEGIFINGDLNSMQIALTNLLENAWKFTGKQKNPLIEFGMTLKEEKKIFFIRDNGAGFDMAYVNKLFGAFQRLHKTGDFPGTGIGLATVKRIITRHGGQIWAEGEVGKGATFYFTLPE